MARAAEALHYAHSQNVVHRDVKPANLMYDIANDRLKLTDFGIARLTDCEPDPDWYHPRYAVLHVAGTTVSQQGFRARPISTPWA